MAQCYLCNNETCLHVQGRPVCTICDANPTRSRVEMAIESPTSVKESQEPVDFVDVD
jgi:hypothetical protein